MNSPPHDGHDSGTGLAAALGRLAPRWIVAVGLLVFAAGFASHRMWTELPWERLALSIVLALGACLVAWPLRRLASVDRALAVACAWLFALLFFSSLPQLGAVLLLAAAALAIGTYFVPDNLPARAAVATCVGLAVLVGVAGWTLSWPIHSPLLWYPLLMAIVLLRRNQLRAVSAETIVALQHAVAAGPRWSAFAIMLLGLASTACWLPTMQVDDLAYHID
ncbi:MAG TPA: hypothetical protein VFY12_10550, partial [Arenimonas sp.]|nr:hypothetical protein [Arenimonas sp.]